MARACIRSPCGPNRLSTSAGSSPVLPNQCGTRVSNSATSPGPEHQVVVAEDEPHPAGQDVQPLVALVRLGSRLGCFGVGMTIFQACTPPGWRVSGTTVRPCTRRGFSRIRGSPTSGAPTRSSSGTR